MGSFRENILEETDAEVNARHRFIGELLQQIGLKALKELKKKSQKRRGRQKKY